MFSPRWAQNKTPKNMMSSENIQALMFMSVTHSLVLSLAEESSLHQKDDHALTMTVLKNRCLPI